MTELSIQRMGSGEFEPKAGLIYKDVFDLMSLYEGLAFRAPTIVVGPKGIGKTLSIQAFAAQQDCPIVTFDCSEDVRRQHLIGIFVLRGQETPFVLGPLTTAFEVANEVGQCILCLEEINCLYPTTTVLVPSGEEVPIERLRLGDPVVGFDPAGGQCLAHVVETRYQRADSSYTIEAGEEIIKASENHLFWTRRGWVPAKFLQEGDEVLRVCEVWLPQKGPEVSSGARTDGSREESDEESGMRREGSHGGSEREDFKSRNSAVEGPGVPGDDERVSTGVASHGQPQGEIKDVRNPEASDAFGMEGSEKERTSLGELSDAGVPRDCGERGKEDRCVLEVPRRKKDSFDALQEALGGRETPEAHVRKAKTASTGSSRQEDTVRTCGMERSTPNEVGTSGHRDSSRPSSLLHRGRNEMDHYTQRATFESGLFGGRQESDSCGWGLLAPTESEEVRDFGLQERGILSSSLVGRPSEEPSSTCAKAGPEIPLWVTVRRVTRNLEATPLCEIGLTGPHTYFASGLGTHNSLTPQMQKVLNAPTDWRQRIEVPEARKVFRLEKGKKIWVTGTMNTAVYGGVYQLNEDLKSRMRLVALTYPKSSKEKEIIAAVLSDTSLDQSVVDRVILLAHETRQQSLEYALSTRDVVQLLEDIAAMDLTRALRIVLGKFDDTDRDTVAERIQSIFGVSFDQTSRRRGAAARA